ncbi:beta-lactamase/transpeptidase-like protein [Aspergillus ellipticus CBS 707.79]|uniref:Beta-lactamase/transpeptidase-like protein n=1 Tax=Aspergillus ellipticus CBS 707.79 TaxID=1448320 RepID=A0A319DK25_9EURO|nr:beta-lactamase/transpeptidase-like protein [Aspergillus ellipticus CBS 707.79]
MAEIQKILDNVPLRHRGPGGAIAVVKDGELVAQRIWGYADVDKRVHMTPDTLMPICSITKQFVCALLLDLKRNPTPEMAAKGDIEGQFDEKLRELLHPDLLKDSGLTLDHLCDMQSGMRDYWTMTALWGTKPEDEFLVARDCPPMLERTKSFHFAPGTEYSYCNVNFHVLARVIERVAGDSIENLLAKRILAPAGMHTAFLTPDNAKLPPPCLGYEGTEQTGFVPALNRMEWSGDAGLSASLVDMVAWEKHLQRLYSDKDTWYYKIAQPNTYSDGKYAPYRYGMAHSDVNGVDTFGHAGALRGYRSQRRHALNEGLSVVVLFNYEPDVIGAVDDVFRDLLNKPNPEYPSVEPSEAWVGSFLDRDTQLVIPVAKGPKTGEVFITFGGKTIVHLTDPTHGEALNATASIEGDILHMHKVTDNRKLEAQRLVPRDESFKDPAVCGDYKCDEIESSLHIWGDAGMLYGEFDGYLGQGTATTMKYVGDDVWILTCPRGLDSPAPGDWTVVFHRDEHDSSKIVGFKIGAWGARGIDFVKV